MDNRINQNKNYNINFNASVPKGANAGGINMSGLNNGLEKGAKEFENKIKEAINKIYEKAQTMAVPEYGTFSPVYEEFKNPAKDLFASDFMIKIYQPPVGVENRETKRALELAAYKDSAPYKATRLISSGTKNDILKKLQDESLLDEFVETFKTLSKSLEESLRDL